MTITSSKYGQYIENNEFRRRLDLMGDEFEGIRQLIMRLLSKFHSSKMPFSLEIDSNIPQGRGLGASASLATAIIRAFMISLMLNFRKRFTLLCQLFRKYYSRKIFWN